MNPRSPTRPLSRLLIASWCIWLLLSLLINRAVHSTSIMHDDSASVAPAVRGMLQSMMVGLGLIWPAWRLSAGRVSRAGLETAGDLMAMFLLAQPVIWLEHIRLMYDTQIQWSVARTTLIDLTILIWCVPVGLCVWVGRSSRWTLSPGWLMALSTTLLFGGWVVTWITGQHAAAYSPWYALWTLCEPDASRVELAVVAWRLALVAAISAAGWVFLLRRRREPLQA